jgi:hypothetical protein
VYRAIAVSKYSSDPSSGDTQYSQWRYQVRVGEGYHVEYEQNEYSVLYTYAHQHVDIRANDEFVHMYYQRRLVASHTRKFGPGNRYVSATQSGRQTPLRQLPENREIVTARCPERQLAEPHRIDLHLCLIFELSGL